MKLLFFFHRQLHFLPVSLSPPAFSRFRAFGKISGTATWKFVMPAFFSFRELSALRIFRRRAWLGCLAACKASAFLFFFLRMAEFDKGNGAREGRRSGDVRWLVLLRALACSSLPVRGGWRNPRRADFSGVRAALEGSRGRRCCVPWVCLSAAALRLWSSQMVRGLFPGAFAFSA